MAADPRAPWLLELPPPDAPAGPAALPADTLGLALSGGGIRSAAFSLGVVQALSRAGWLPRVDYLSTVSGGGYTGAFLGRFFDQCGRPDGLTGAIPDPSVGAGQDRVARDLADARSAPIAWLRRHANYLSPTGRGEAVTNVAGFFRNLISVYLVLAAFLFAGFGVLNALGYADWPGWIQEAVAVLTPVTGDLMGRAGPWAVVAEVGVWLAVVPLALAYWLVSQEVPEAFNWPVLTAAAIVAGAALWAVGSPLGLAVLAFAVVWALAVWSVVRRDEGHNDQLHPARLALARNRLTRWLAFWLGAVAAAAALAVVDWLGRWLAGRMVLGGMTGPNMTAWGTSVGAGVIGLATALRMVVRFLGDGGRGGSAVLAASRPYLVAALIMLIGVVPPLAALSFASHVAYELGDAYRTGLLATGLAVVVSLLLGVKDCVPFINRSGPLAIYASRLARAFLGAVNPARRTHPEGRNVAHVVPGDDVPLADYAPHAAGGPLHLINCTVNETVDVASQRGLRDRQGENLAVGPAGMSVAQQWHAVWVAGLSGTHLDPLTEPAEAAPHPLLSAAGGPVAVESLGLREWVGISAGAVGPGMGRATGFPRSLLFTLANLRLGYWWNSGLGIRDRRHVPVGRGAWPLLTRGFIQLFRTQALLLAELTGRFAGPWERYWHLSDGGNFENTGGYELLRRRVPFVIVVDAGQDTAHQGVGLAGLIRLARIDLGAEVEEVDASRVPSAVAARLGPVADLLPPVGEPAKRHAALLLVRYPLSPVRQTDDAWLRRGHTWLLYLKATVTGDEPADVRAYAARHPDFPDEPTLDQVFDEPQWESYRKLGEHVGEAVFI